MSGWRTGLGVGMAVARDLRLVGFWGQMNGEESAEEFCIGSIPRSMPHSLLSLDPYR